MESHRGQMNTLNPSTSPLQTKHVFKFLYTVTSFSSTRSNSRNEPGLQPTAHSVRGAPQTALLLRRLAPYLWRQRVKLAQTIAHDPDVVFLDEPLAGMDPVGRHRVLELVRQWVISLI